MAPKCLIGRDERGHVHDGGGADERIDQAQSVRQRQSVDELGRPRVQRNLGNL